MYAVAVRREFIARHFLVGGEWGRENELHSHHYRVEARLDGAATDQHGYLVDILHIESSLEELVARYRDRTLNDLPEFDGLNPSLERFARFFHDGLASRLRVPGPLSLTVTIWENELAWASFRRDL